MYRPAVPYDRPGNRTGLMAEAVAKQLQEKLPGDSVDQVEAEFTAVIIRTAELAIPWKGKKGPGEDGVETHKQK